MKYFLVAIALLFAGKSISQTPNFQRRYDASYSIYPYAMQQTPDSGFIIGGATDPQISKANFDHEDSSRLAGKGQDDGGALLLKTDKYGNNQWQNSITIDGKGATIWSITPATDQHYIIAGTVDASYSFVAKADGNGSIVWCKTIFAANSSLVVAAHVYQSSDGDIVVGGMADQFFSSKFFLIKLSGDGEVIWKYCYGDSTLINGGFFTEATDKGFLITGFRDFIPGVGYKLLTAKVDSLGQIEWSRKWNDGRAKGYDVISTPDGGYLLTGLYDDGGSMGGLDILATKLSPDGSVVWAKTYDGGSLDNAYGIHRWGSDIIVSGTSRNNGEKTFLMTLDSLGNIKWAKIYGDTAKQFTFQSVITRDSFIATAGFADYYFGCLVKSNATGQTGCNENAFSPVVSTLQVDDSILTLNADSVIEWDPLESTCRHASLSIL